MDERVLYKKPPIVERIIGAYQDIPQDDFERKLPSWVEKIRHDFPVEQHISEWKIDIEDKNGVPFVKSLEPKARIIRLYWQKHKKNSRVIGMRIRPDRLVFHLCREENNPHEFSELLPYMEQWLPRWAEHFGITEINGITVEYYNVLDGNITPQFASQEGIRVGDALTVFSNFPGAHQGITNPYDCKVRLILDMDTPRWLDFRVRADDRSAGAVRVDFEVVTFPQQKRLSFSEAIAEIVAGHEVILRQFSCFFTEQARNSFL